MASQPTPIQPGRRESERPGEAAPPVVPVVVQAPPTRSVLGSLAQALVVLLLLGCLAGLGLLLLALSSVLAFPRDVGTSVSGAVGEAGRAVTAAGEALRGATDPARPPQGLAYDTEIVALQIVRVGEALPGGSDYALTLTGIKRRDGNSSPDTALYAVVRAELRQARETRILGQVVRTDRDPREHVLYKGESFRVGSTIYRVNWVSLEQGAMALATYRRPDEMVGTLKFAYD